MDINRNNYEAHLLQYVDGELDAAGQKAVEAFLHQNPDLQEELLMLQQTVLQAETHIFNDKALLFKTSEATQAQLLQYLDNELPAAEAALLAQQIDTDQALRQEWQILQQTRLDAEDKLVFANKASLYRQAPGRVIAFKWWRVAAAALLLGFGVWGGMSLLHTHKGGNAENGLANTPAVNSTQPLATPSTNNPGTNAKQSGDNNNNLASVDNNNNTSATPVIKPTNDSPILTKDNSASVAQQLPKAVRWSNRANTVSGQNDLERVQKKSEKIISQNFNTDNGNEIATTNVTLTNSQLEPAVAAPAEKINTEKNDAVEKVLKGSAAVAVNETNDVGASNSYLATSSKKIRKSGLLRKVTRFFQRSLNNRGEGDGLKIAGFEFAVR